MEKQPEIEKIDQDFNEKKEEIEEENQVEEKTNPF